MLTKKEAARRARQRAGGIENRLAWRIDEWVALTGTSRPTVWRHAKAGTLKIVYHGSIPLIPRSEAIRLGFVEA